MTLSPVEIARKVLEAAKGTTPRPWAEDGSLDGEWVNFGTKRFWIPEQTFDGDGRFQARCDAAFVAACVNGAEALARAVIELSAENDTFRDLLFLSHGSWETHHLYGDDGERQCGACMVDFNRDSAQTIHEKIVAFNLKALAALSPTEGDGRKENNG